MTFVNTPARSDNFFTEQLSKKRVWTPITPQKNPVKPGSELLIDRALCLRILEIPVGDFIKDASKSDLNIPESGRLLLQSNVEDEIRHDIALEKAYSVLGLNNEKHLQGAEALKDAWINLDAHPILKALVLESSIFFVILPMFRFLGNIGLNITQAEISKDERTHVAANTETCRLMGIDSSKKVDRLRRETIAWITEDLVENLNNQYLDRDFWIRQSDSLYKFGKADGFRETKRAQFLAFFETDALETPQYY